MAIPYRLIDNPDGSVDILLFPGGGEELARELFPFRALRSPEARRVLYVRAVKVVLAGGLAVTLPLSSLASRRTGDNYAMSYIYFGTAEQQTQNALRAADVLDVISPSYFDLNADGSLKLNAVSQSFVSSMHSRGIRVVPFLSNHWDRTSGVAALENAEALSTQIAQAVEKYNLDGVNVDIENVTHTHRAQYVELVRLLRQKLPQGKEVSVAVAANPKGWSTGWHGSYDYAGLARYADHLFLMTYDEHYSGGDAGPVASYSFVEQSIEYALRHVSADKLVLGIPFFGRMWNEAGTVAGQGVSLEQVRSIKGEFGGSVGYDSERRSPVLYTTLTRSIKVSGHTLPAGKYEIWYENADSIKAKLALVNRYGLKGAGNWSAGQETTDVWDYYELWLNGTYFSDISNHFAKDEIIRLSGEGVLKGVSDSQFGPEQRLTRAQAAAIAVRTLGLPLSDEQAPFSDTRWHWANREIAAAVRVGLFEGYPDGTFRPDAPVTRAEMTAVLARMLEASLEGRGAGFSDLTESHWAYHEIIALSQMGILNGYTDGTFRPDAAITRGEGAAILGRAWDELKK